MELKEYLHYYMWQKCKVMYNKEEIEREVTIHPANLHELLHEVKYCKPILRRIEDMTDEEISAVGKMHTFKEAFGKPITSSKLLNDIRTMTLDKNYRTNIQSFHYLLSIGIDLFDLIPNNLALDKNKV